MDIGIMMKQRAGGAVVGSASTSGTTDDAGATITLPAGMLPGLQAALDAGDVELSIGADVWTPTGGTVAVQDDGTQIATVTQPEEEPKAPGVVDKLLGLIGL